MKEIHEVSHQVLMLYDMLKKVWAGRLRIGAFDTPCSNAHETELLLDSVRRGIPMGALTVWDTEEDHEVHDVRSAGLHRHHCCPTDFQMKAA